MGSDELRRPGSAPPLLGKRTGICPCALRVGHVRVAIRVVNPLDRARFLDLSEPLVDTGATLTTLPRFIAEELGLDVEGRSEVSTAAGVTTTDRSVARIEFENHVAT